MDFLTNSYLLFWFWVSCFSDIEHPLPQQAALFLWGINQLMDSETLSKNSDFILLLLSDLGARLVISDNFISLLRTHLETYQRLLTLDLWHLVLRWS